MALDGFTKTGFGHRIHIHQIELQRGRDLRLQPVVRQIRVRIGPVVGLNGEIHIGRGARHPRRALRNVRPKPAFTLIPITPARFEEKKAAGDYFFKTIQEEGICVAEKVALGERRRPALSPRRKERQGVAP